MSDLGLVRLGPGTTDWVLAVLCCWQNYCQDFPSDPVCAPPSCILVADVAKNLQYCDANDCKSNSASKASCMQVCTPDYLSQLDTAAADELKAECAAQCAYGGTAGSYICSQFCLNFPTDAACSPRVRQRGRELQTASAPICALEAQFESNVATCDQSLCSTFLWRDATLPANTTGLSTCRFACSGVNLGPVGTPSSATLRAKCTSRCSPTNWNSYVCQVGGARHRKATIQGRLTPPSEIPKGMPS